MTQARSTDAERAGTRPAITLDGVVLERESWRIGFDLTVREGEWLAVVGPSGAGKSTLLDLLAGFVTPTRGTITIDGRAMAGVEPAARPLSMVFQDNNLFAHLSAARNVALGIAPNRRLTAEEKRAVADGLAAVGLAGMGERRPFEMSGGERQRVALARAFLRRRPLLLLDEPFASLGPALRAEMLAILADLRTRFSAPPLTIVMVTHHPEDAEAHADRVAFVDGGEIAALGPAGAMLGPDAPPLVRRYLGAARRESAGESESAGRRAEGAPDHDPVRRI